MPVIAAVYARFSSDNQREESIDAQIRACQDYAARNDLQIVKVYVDRAKSATTDKRPEFQQMIADSGKELFEAVIIHKLDRFSRDKYDSARYKRKLKMNGVQLFSVTENLDGSPESIILESLLEGMAEYYSKNLAREVMKGMKENAYQCKHTGGHPPLGYDVDPVTKKYVINETEATAVKAIFQLYLDGYGYDRIIRELNARGFRTKKGQPFGKNSIHDILANEKYSGVYVFNRANNKDLNGRRNNHAAKATDQMIRIPGGVPVIIEPEQFEQAQRKMAQNKRQPGSYKAKETYLLSGLIVCGECLQREGKPSAMMGNVKYSGRAKTKHVTYRCGNRHRNHRCDNKEIRREYIENYVLSELQKRIFNEKAIPTLVQKLNAYREQSGTERQQDIQRLRDERNEVTRQIDNIVEAVAQGFGQALLADKLAELEEHKIAVETTLQELYSKHQQPEITPETLRNLFAVFRQSIAERNIPEVKKFISNYVEQVIVYKDHVEVVFFIGCDQLETDGYRFKTRITRSRLMQFQQWAA